MIRSFGDRLTEDLYHGRRSRSVQRLPGPLVKGILRKLDMIEAALRLEDLRSPPGNRLESLTGDLKGWCSIRVNDQWRIIFRWDGAAEEVKLADYH
ncbi:MAG: type II toxin-antitoxin system RelE/ParE family toxin [Deltaproteobacteria bacterium]|nr:type II toxin-antitoxin system RelE/ParE family toxin [Deltaproteobacteria bacterium]